MSEIKNVDYGLEKIFDGAKDFLPLLGTDYVEFYVGNAKQAAYYYKSAFGFQSYAYKGLETGSRDVVSYVLKQDKICVVLTTPLNSKSNINDHIVKHGDGVKVIALWVDDATKSWRETTSRGAKSYMKPTIEKMSMVRSYDLEYSPMEIQYMFLLREKTIKEYFFLVLKNGDQISTQSQVV